MSSGKLRLLRCYVALGDVPTVPSPSQHHNDHRHGACMQERERVAYCSNLGVTKQARRGGLATRLLQHVEQVHSRTLLIRAPGCVPATGRTGGGVMGGGGYCGQCRVGGGVGGVPLYC